MLNIYTLFALTGLLQEAIASISYELVNSITVPKLKSDFSKNNVTAQWAPSYPKEWGSEDASQQFGEPDPGVVTSATVSGDEKYLAITNGTHVTVVDLNANSTVSTFSLGNTTGLVVNDISLRSIPSSGYNILTSLRDPNFTYRIIRQRITTDAKPFGEATTFQAGNAIERYAGSINRQGKLASTAGYTADLNSENSTIIPLDGQPSFTDVSISPDGNYVSSVHWSSYTNDLWNATSGKKIFSFPGLDRSTQPWETRISPDGKYVALGYGSGINVNNTIHVYSIANLSGTPVTLGGFNYWARSFEYSPDAKYLAAGDNDRIRVWKMPEGQLVQTWEVESQNNDAILPVYAIEWLDDGKKLAFILRDTRVMYDFEQNVKWYWMPRAYDHLWGNDGIWFLKEKGLVATGNADSVVRFWKI